MFAPLVITAVGMFAQFAASQEYSGTCVDGLVPLLPTVDGTRPACDSARAQIQRVLYGCTIDDPEHYVKSSLIFTSVYGKGEDCHDVEGPYPECHAVPLCWKNVIKVDDIGEFVYDCGDDNENTDNMIACIDTEVTAGCEVIGNKLKKIFRGGGDAICGNSNSASNLLSSSFVLLVTVALVTSVLMS